MSSYLANEENVTLFVHWVLQQDAKTSSMTMSPAAIKTLIAYATKLLKRLTLEPMKGDADTLLARYLAWAEAQRADWCSLVYESLPSLCVCVCVCVCC